MTLLVPSVAAAGPISLGVWSALPPADHDGYPFWDGVSWDGPTKGVGYFLGEYSGYDYDELEYLHDGTGHFTAFTFDDPFIITTFLSGITAWTNGSLSRNAAGAFTYDSGTGRLSNSLDSPGQYALFRYVTPGMAHYVLGVEDILLSEEFNDRDYNDHIVAFAVPTPIPDAVPTAIPEPSMLLLLGSSLAGLAVRKVATRRRTP